MLYTDKLKYAIHCDGHQLQRQTETYARIYHDT